MRRVFLVTAACLVLASPAFAGGGVDLYTGYGEVIDGEGSLALGIRVSLGSENWLVDLAATGHRKVEDVKVIDANPNDDDTATMRVFDLGLRYLFYDGHKLRPYVGAGASYHALSGTYVKLDAGLGLYAMGGLRYGKTPGIQFMGELIYRWAEVDASFDYGETVELDSAGLAIQLGVSFVF